MEETKGLYEGLCSSCTFGIFCPTWTNWKCIIRARRYPYAGAKECADYKRQSVGCKEAPCQCDDCLRNEKLSEEIEEG